MRIHSELSAKQYLKEMRRQMYSVTDFGVDRFTGLFLRNWFSVTYHSHWEWNSGVTNSAIGFVRSAEKGCTVHCFCLRGMTTPLRLVSAFLVGYLMSCVFFFFDPIMASNSEELYFWIHLTVGLGTMVFGALRTAIRASTTALGIEGRWTLKALLHHPEDPYNHIVED